MVKLPEGMECGDPQFLSDRSQFLHDYGTVFAHWSMFELAIELTFMRLSGLTPKHASIIFSGLNFGAKSSIVKCLANEEGKPEIANVITDVINLARRNALAHGAMGSDEDAKTFGFFSREVKASYSVKHWEFTAEEFHAHMTKMRIALIKAFEVMQITESQIEQYGREAGIAE